ncbi:hypothetical protein [Kitasatospora paranensis]|uniref:DUF4190 domain-containing protein n=1 Tax=Kitasatospora paranensis TaxID=258053 RepID=A0ABW2FV06_9ACTN
MSQPIHEATPDAHAPYGYPAPVEPKRRNGFAVASLIFGLIGGMLFGLGFGIAGLVRAKKVGRGKVMSWIGIVLSILWIAPVAYVVPHLLKASDSGCVSAKQTIATYGEAKLNADQSDPTALKADFQALATQLADAAAKSGDATARAAIQRLAGDFQELNTALAAGQAPAADLEGRLTADGTKVDSACGTFGS